MHWVVVQLHGCVSWHTRVPSSLVLVLKVGRRASVLFTEDSTGPMQGFVRAAHAHACLLACLVESHRMSCPTV